MQDSCRNNGLRKYLRAIPKFVRTDEKSEMRALGAARKETAGQGGRHP